MATFQRFQDIKAWQLARNLANLAYKLTKLRAFSSDPPLRFQIRKAAISMPANIAEGFGRGGNREFHQFLAQARGSADEVLSHFIMAHDLAYISDDDFHLVETLHDETSAAIHGLMQYLRNAPVRGHKFRDGPAPKGN